MQKLTKAVALRAIPEHSTLEKTIQTYLMNLKEFGFKVPEKITWRTADMGPNVLEGIKELEAQSIAAIVTQSLGLETKMWDFSYVASWAGKMATNKFRKNLEIISKCAQAELKAIR